MHSESLQIIKSSIALTKVPYALPHETAREFIPRQIGTIQTVKLYAASPVFWAVTRKDAGRYFVQFATLFGANHRGYIVTAKAVAEFAKHTKQLGELLRLVEFLGWEDLALELKTPNQPGQIQP